MAKTIVPQICHTTLEDLPHTSLPNPSFFMKILTGVVSEGAAGSWNKSFIPSIDANHPKPLRVRCVEHPDSLALADKNFILFLGFKVMYHNQLFNVMLDKGVYSRFCSMRTSGVGPVVRIASMSLALSAETVTIKSGHVSSIHSVHNSGLNRRATSDSVTASIDAVTMGHFASLRRHTCALGCSRNVRKPRRRGWHVSVVAGQVRIVDTGDLWLGLVAVVLPRRPHVAEGNESRVAMLRHAEDPIVFSIQHSHPLSLTHCQLLVAAGMVVAEGRHAQIGWALLRRSKEDLNLEAAIALGDVAAVHVCVGLVARQVNGAAASRALRRVDEDFSADFVLAYNSWRHNGAGKMAVCPSSGLVWAATAAGGGGTVGTRTAGTSLEWRRDEGVHEATHRSLLTRRFRRPRFATCEVNSEQIHYEF